MNSTQSRLGYFGGRWGCAVTTLIITLEHFRGRPATEDELDRIGGRFVRLGNKSTPPPCYVSNYKNHDDIWNNNEPQDGWSHQADPEAHWFIRDWRWTFAEIADVMQVSLANLKSSPRNQYEIWVMDVDPTSGVSTHFVPAHRRAIIKNPSPGLEGPVIEKRLLPI